jgi:hypothetical protein
MQTSRVRFARRVLKAYSRKGMMSERAVGESGRGKVMYAHVNGMEMRGWKVEGGGSREVEVTG